MDGWADAGDGWMDGPMADLACRRGWRVAVGGGARRGLRRGLRCGLDAAAQRVRAAHYRRHRPFNWTVAGGWSGRRPVMAVGAGGVDNGEGVSAGVGGVDELELWHIFSFGGYFFFGWEHGGTGGDGIF